MYHDTLAPQALDLLLSVPCNRLAPGAHHTPPGQPDAVGQDIAYGPGGSGEAGAPGDLAIADNLATTQIAYDAGDRGNERATSAAGLADASEVRPSGRCGRRIGQQHIP
jgi:hypothetical protein